MSKRWAMLKRVVACMLVLILSVSMIPAGSGVVQAASKKAALSRKNVSVYVGKTVKVKLKHVKKKVKWQVVSGKKVVSVKTTGKYKNTVAIRGRKAGKAKIRATYNKQKYVVKVSVKKKKITETKNPVTNTEDKNMATPEQQVNPESGSSNGSSIGTSPETPGAGTENGSTSVEKSEEIPEEKPEEVPEEKPEEVPEEKPEETPEEKPEETPEEKPEEAPEEKPEEVPEEKPEEVPEEKPEETPEEKPEETPEEKPEEVPEEKPEENPEEKPEEVPEEKPEETPEEKPEEVPEEKPEELPKNIVLDTYFDKVDVASSSTTGQGNETSNNLFDGDISTKLYTPDACPVRIAWQMKQPVVLKKYTITTAGDAAIYTHRNPQAWHLYGSNDATTWTQIDTVDKSGIEAANSTPYTYETDVQESYQYYLLQVESNGGYYEIQLADISMFGDVSQVAEDNSVSLSAYDILFTGDWDEITNAEYVDELVKLFYNSYPRLYARWGNGTEPKTITFKADSNYDGVAYCQGTEVVVSTAYANAHPNDIGFFSHEITHSVQQYNGTLNYGDEVAWWTENMANYGGFRYFHWSNPEYVQVYEASDSSLQDWGYEQYGNNKWFFAYMDAKYPTRKDTAGNISYGLVDSINILIKNNNTGTAYTDDPYDTTTPFNQVVYQLTGYDCIESLRLKFVEELQAGTWTFEGFANYEDNWITENIPGVANPDYPMLGEKTHGNKTGEQLKEAVTDGENLCAGASVMESSGYTNDAERPYMLIDGNLSTKWCATSGSVTNPEYKLNGVAHWVKIDLGTQKSFDTYTIYNTQSREGYGNTTEWELLISDDGENWTSVDYQSSNNSAVASFDIGEQTARYVFIKVFTPDDGVGTVRLYEFQLYDR